MSTDTRGLGVSAFSGQAATDILHSGTGTELTRALRALRGSDRELFQNEIGSDSFRELESLAGESDREIFAEGMLHWAGRLESRDRVSAAAAVYQGLAEAPGVGSRAQDRLHALVGGASTHRAEFLLRHLSTEVMRPEPLAAMAVGGLVFRAVRLGTMSRLLLRPSGGFLASPLSARWLAGAAGFLAEGGAFALTQKSLSHALGAPSDWSAGTLARDVSSSLLVLGGLRLGGFAADTAVRRLGGASRFLPALYRQGGMLGGILLGHRLEEAAGLRTAAPTTVLDSMVTLLQFNLMGNLNARVLGPGFRAMELSLELQASRLASRVPHSPPNLFDGFGPAPGRLAWASGTSGRTPGTRSPLEGPQISLMSAGGENGDKPGGRRAGGNDPTLPFPIRAAELPLVFPSIHTVIRQLNDARLGFPERLASGDMLIKVLENVSDATREGFPKVLLQFLNSTSARHPVPAGRRVELQIHNHPILNFVRVGEEFLIEDPAHPFPAVRVPEGPPSSPPVLRGDDNRTLPFGVESGGKDPLVSLLSVELLRRIRDPHYRFAEYVRQQDVEFTLEKEDAFDQEGFFRILTRVLNEIPEIPLGRRVAFNLKPSQHRVFLVRGSEGFHQPSHPAPESPDRARMGTADTVIASASALQPPTRSPVSPIPSPPPSKPDATGGAKRASAAVSKPLENSLGVPLLFRDLTRLPEVLTQALRLRSEDEHPIPLILELPRVAEGGHPVTAEALQRLAPRLGVGVPRTMFFDLNVPAHRESFLGEIRGTEISWRKGSNHLLNHAAIQVFSHTINAQNPTLLYQVLESLAREPRGPEVETTLHYNGPYPRSTAGDFAEFVRQALNTLAMPGRLLRVIPESGEVPIVFQGRNGRWKLPAPELRVAGSQLELRPALDEILDRQGGISALDIILERRTVLTTPEIRRIEESLGALGSARRLRIHDLKGRKTVLFERTAAGLAFLSENWPRPDNMQNFSGETVTELVQRMAFLRNLVMAHSALRAELTGPEGLEPQLSNFLEVLNRWTWFPAPNFELDVTGPVQAQNWRFSRETDGWHAVRVR